MIWFVYNALFAIGFTLMLPHFLLRMWRRGGYRRGFLQRLAWYPPGLRARILSRPRIWIHAVSVGEMHVALRLLKELRAATPGAAFVLSTNTSTAHRIAGSRLAPDDVLIYFPCDFPAVMRRALDVINPVAIMLVEGEVWPNLIRQARGRGIPVALVNGRMSDRSFRGYRRVGVFFRPVLHMLEMLLVQSEEDARRFVALGARPATVHTLGSAKYDVAVGDGTPPADAGDVLDACGMAGRGLVIAGGSTWDGEEDALLDAFVQLRPRFSGLKLVLVPRHAERRAEVEAAIRQRPVTYARRSDMAAAAWRAPERTDVLLVDTTGELPRFYRSADVIFVGKSLTARGGQNIIEPACLNKPILVGPHMDNFRDVTADFLKAQALVQVRDGDGLAAELERLLSDPGLRDEYGRRAAAVVQAHCGVVSASVMRLVRGLGLAGARAD